MAVYEKSDKSLKNDLALGTVAPLAPITFKRTIRSDLERFLPKPYLARVIAAPDTTNPNGTPRHENHGMSVLQQYVAFFDQDHNGIVYPWETYKGFRGMGFNVVFSVILAIGFNLVFSYPTSPGWIPSPLFPVYINNIHKAKHGSDSDVYNTEGRFVPVNFENMFSKYAQVQCLFIFLSSVGSSYIFLYLRFVPVNFENMFSKYAQVAPDKLTLLEIWNMTEGNRNAYDIFGGVVAKLKWGLLYIIARDGDHGFLSREVVRGLFDGSLFEYFARARHQH